jgi:hypothetical protein
VPQSRGSGRVYGSSAAQPVSPAAQVISAPPAVQPTADAAPAAVRIPTQPGPQSRSAGAATARASVSVGRVSQAEAAAVPQSSAQPGVYGAPAQPAVYGGPAQPAAYGSAAQPAPEPFSAAAQPPTPAQPPASPAPTGRAAGMPAYSDLLGPAQMPPAAPAASGQWGAPGQGPGGQPAGPVSAQRPPQAPAEPEQNRFDKFSAEPEPPASSRGGTAKVLVMVIAACVLLIGVAFGVLFAVNKLLGGSDPELAVGQCVQRDGNTAVVIDCGSAGAGSFKITKKVSDQKDCPNPQNDALTQGSDIFCLEPNG